MQLATESYIPNGVSGLPVLQYENRYTWS